MSCRRVCRFVAWSASIAVLIAVAPPSGAATASVAPSAAASEERVQLTRHVGAVRLVGTPADQVAAIEDAAQCRAKPLRPVASRQLAVSSTWRWVSRREGRVRVSRLRHDLEHRPPAHAAAMASRALSTGRPGAAVVASLVLAELKPASALPWISAAGLLAGLGRPREALPLIDGSPRPAPREQVAGIPTTAIRDTARGWALLGLGRHLPAYRLFSRAAASAPGLSEAATGAALASACAKPSATATVRIARWSARSLDRGESLVTWGEDPRVALPEHYLGTPDTESPLPFWRVELPVSIADSEVAFARISRLAEAAEAREHALDDPISEAEQRAQDAERSWRHGYEPWRDALFWLQLDAVADAPSVRPASDAYWAAISDLRDLVGSEGYWHGGELGGPRDFECASAMPEYETLMRATGAFIDASNTYIQAAYAQRLAIARLSANPERRSYLRMMALRHAEHDRAWGLRWTATMVGEGHWWSHCGVPGSGDDDDVPAYLPAPDKPCPAYVQFNLDLEFVEITADCEKFSVTAQTAGPLGGFISAEQAWGKRAITVFAGGQAKLGNVVLKAEAKAGAYVTFDDRGVVDAGARAQAEVKIVAGTLQVTKGAAWSQSVIVPAGPLQLYRP